MQLVDETFDVVLDKGGLDALMEPELGPALGNQYLSEVRGLQEALESENQICTEYSSSSDILYSLEDLQIGAKGDLTELSPGRWVLLTLGQQGASRFCFKVVLLDAQQQSSSFVYHCGVFLVPKFSFFGIPLLSRAVNIQAALLTEVLSNLLCSGRNLI
ncbi:uncharacterized protein LOC130783256 [Actinidia eriantha]|uniref:uncharacterized protein LOC130783256 n=1 Tax=Actinidia eriantha TaxID=165200 RepID=UPI002589C0C9|nr:uncharacterized protein LOC130783256 [Actinidia eriantha]